jgi:hypothetical protein
MKLFLFLLVLFPALSVNAQDINFNFTTGSSQSYNIEDIRKITFDNLLMLIHLTDGSVYTIDTETIEDNTYTQINALSDINSLCIDIFPNPVQNTLHILYGKEQNPIVTIFDQMSKIVLEKNICNSSIDVSNLTPATYIVIVKVNHISKSFKLIKQ